MDKGYDVIVIGGGPGGSSAATFLAKGNQRVLVLEKEKFPRFHIGESLLPYNQQIFRDMGVLPTLEAAGLMRKFGAQFHMGNGSKSLALVFRNGKFTRETSSFQVERSKFDHVLLKHAASCGAEVREGCTVARFDATEDSVSVEVRNEQGQTETMKAKYIIDASGRGNLTGTQLGLREFHPRLKKLSVFGHFSGVKLDAGEKAGDTIIIRLANKWFWIIPLSHEKISVGLVMDKDEFTALKQMPEEIFTSVWQSSSTLREKMKEAKLLGTIQVISDFSYRNKRLTEPRVLRVGDAAGFMDPIFSSGVFLAMYSGKLAAEAILISNAKPSQKEKLFRNYEKSVFRGMDFYWEMVEGYYTKPFMDLFMNPREKWDLPSAVVAVLAGEVDGGWRIAWRMKLFFLLVRLQKKYPLVPRLSYATK
jgi:flavin-dependent dehydrogenase